MSCRVVDSHTLNGVPDLHARLLYEAAGTGVVDVPANGNAWSLDWRGSVDGFCYPTMLEACVPTDEHADRRRLVVLRLQTGGIAVYYSTVSRGGDIRLRRNGNDVRNALYDADGNVQITNARVKVGVRYERLKDCGAVCGRNRKRPDCGWCWCSNPPECAWCWHIQICSRKRGLLCVGVVIEAEVFRY